MRLRISLMIAIIVAAPVASAADSMRCSNRVIGDGDPKAKVAELCGKPTQTERRTVYRSGLPRHEFADGARTRPVSGRELVIHDRSIVEVEVDIWLYNRGRSRLMREVVFLDGRVVEVNVLGRGY